MLDQLGQTLNLETLGGLALAVGILVDDATVEVENFHRQRALNKPIAEAILDGAQEISGPCLRLDVEAICIVFVPVTFIAGAAKSLFVPLALAVVLAVLTSTTSSHARSYRRWSASCWPRKRRVGRVVDR